MTDPELGLSIVFNGCIYNYGPLREELERLGYRFFSGGDTARLHGSTIAARAIAPGNATCSS